MTSRLALALLGLAACKADLPKLSDAHGNFDAKCTGPYADTLVDYSPTTIMNPTAILGAPDTNSVMLTANDRITVGFVGLGGITDASGTDFTIHAMLDPGASATVRVAGPDMQFIFDGNLTPTMSDFDIQVATLNFISYVRVIVVGGNVSIDSIQATHNTCP